MRLEPKGFLFGRNPVNNYTGNGKTVACFLRNIKATNLTQVYVTELPIDYEICNNYFQISNKRLITNLFTLQRRDLLIHKEQSIEIESELHRNKVSAINCLKRLFRSNIGVVIRNLLWYKNINTLFCEMNDIIEIENPNFMFYDVGNLYAEYDLVLQLCKTNKLPLIIYVSDDYIFAKKPTQYQTRARKHFEELINYASSIIVISDAMKHHYENYISSNYIVAMNGCDKLEFGEKIKSKCLRIVYTGNLGIGRLSVLKHVILALQTMQEGNVFLDIYSSFPLANDEIEKINKSKVASFNGAVFGKELIKAWETADILIHVESFDERYKDILSTAISTKISEYMCTGRPILIVAPDYAESAGFISRIDAGTVINSENTNNIINGIQSIIDNPDKTKLKAKRAKEYAYKYLTKDAVAERVYNAIVEAQEGKR